MTYGWKLGVVRVVIWLCIPLFAALGWQAGYAYNQTLEITYVVDSKIMVTNPHIENPEEKTRLVALGKTRDDTLLLGEAINSEDFRRRLAHNAGVDEESFEVTGTATRSTRVITIRVASQEPETSSLVSVKVFDTMHQYLEENRGLLYFDTGILPTRPEGISAFRAGAGVDWPVAGTALGLLTGITLVAVSTRWTFPRKGH
ncbi:hypothetical protein [Corynebacterium freiburgense]|uniref:hypothetical protein n=1 Tax=Corynebacterium freiburgense TaxID=556548 RepID=UPI0003FF586E|nr:hypothetical protein [Corynebacterium freiburgense]WJZ03142.1 hypothetical protein CFREI_09320 [Corynebacterium freiburgense]